MDPHPCPCGWLYFGGGGPSPLVGQSPTTTRAVGPRFGGPPGRVGDPAPAGPPPGATFGPSGPSEKNQPGSGLTPPFFVLRGGEQCDPGRSSRHRQGELTGWHFSLVGVVQGSDFSPGGAEEPGWSEKTHPATWWSARQKGAKPDKPGCWGRFFGNESCGR